MFGSAAPFWSGVLHFLVTPLALAAVVALIITLGGAAESVVFWAVIGAATTTFAAAELLPLKLQVIASIGVVAVGLFAASGRTPALGLACVIAAVGGTAAGGATSSDVLDWGGSLGAAMTMLVLVSWGVTGLVRIQAVSKLSFSIDIARRVVGASIAALVIVTNILASKGG